MGSYGINLEYLSEIHGIECLEADDRARPPSPHTVAIFQKPDYEFMIFPMVVDWLDGVCSLYALFLEEGIGDRRVVPVMRDISMEMLRSSQSADFVGLLGPYPHATTLAQYIDGYIEKGEWSKWFANP